MTKFSKSSRGVNVVSNYMGGKSFKQSPKEELVFAVVSSFIEKSYYESDDKRIDRISDLVKDICKKDPLFVAKLAVIVRKEFHMRSSFHVLVGELAKVHRGDSLVKNTIVSGVERVDDLVEIVAYLKKPIPNQVKKGVRESLTKFGAYQLSKYKCEGKDVSLVDLFNLVHPKPPKDKKVIWRKLMKGELESPDTWEVKLSGTKNKRKAWKYLVNNNKLGYMALARNLSNLVKHTDKKTVELACSKIADREEVRKSKQLPFRFLSAYLALESEGSKKRLFFEKDSDLSSIAKRAVTKAINYSVDNIPLLEGKTVILSDNSGSMRGDSGGGSLISAMSKRTTSDIANLFATLYWTRANNTLVGLFGDKLIMPKLDREKNVFENFKFIDNQAKRCGAATEQGIFNMFELLIKNREIVDRIVIFSDCQVGTGCSWYDTRGRRAGDFNKLFNRYLLINPKVKVYCVDLKGYGNKLFANNVYLISGWSDKIFNLMQMTDKKGGMVRYIENYQMNLR